jgi:hypothetical protein
MTALEDEEMALLLENGDLESMHEEEACELEEVGKKPLA